MATENWVKIGSGNGLVPSGNKPLPEPMLTSSVRSCGFHGRAISQEMPQLSITKICLKITCLKFHSNFPGANELTHWSLEHVAVILSVIFQLNSQIDSLSTCYEITLKWMSQHLLDNKSTLVQVMAWCRQATSHYLNQFWPRCMSPYGVTRPQWVNSFAPCLQRCGN